MARRPAWNRHRLSDGKAHHPKTIKPADNDYSRDLTRIIAAERLTGFTEPTFISADMWRGIDDEPAPGRNTPSTMPRSPRSGS